MGGYTNYWASTRFKPLFYNEKNILELPVSDEKLKKIMTCDSFADFLSLEIWFAVECRRDKETVKIDEFVREYLNPEQQAIVREYINTEIECIKRKFSTESRD